MVVGTGGINPYQVSATDSEAPYFAKVAGTNGAVATYGALQVNATDTRCRPRSSGPRGPR